MSQFDWVRRFQEYGETSPPPPDILAAQFLQATEALGFRYSACCSHVDPYRPPPQSVMVHNYPGGWVRTFSEMRLYEKDPVLEHAQATAFPFFWDTTLRAETLTKAQRVIMADAAGYGLRHGYTVPIQLSRLPGSLRASCSVIPDSPRVGPQSYMTVELLATYFYLLVAGSHAPWLTEPPKKLTRRERQCLTLALEGHTDAAIARILRLSTSTAHHHIESAKRRMGVATRAQALVNAFAMGLIPFRDYSCGE